MFSEEEVGMLYYWEEKNVLLIIGLGIGYIILYFAKREEKFLQALGYFLGTLIILYCVFCILLNLISGPSRILPRRTLMRPYPQLPQNPRLPAPAK
jgi:hypothetical protein